MVIIVLQVEKLLYENNTWFMMAYNTELVDRIDTVCLATGKYAIFFSSITAENIYYYLFVLFYIVITKTRHPRHVSYLNI